MRLIHQWTPKHFILLERELFLKHPEVFEEQGGILLPFGSSSNHTDSSYVVLELYMKLIVCKRTVCWRDCDSALLRACVN